MTKRPNHEPVAAIRERLRAAYLGAGATLVPDVAEVVERYLEPHRAYHTLEHILECLRWFDASREHAERPGEVELALIYHDVVYDPLRTDNEQRSAALFRAHALASGLSASSSARIVDLIEGTASHRACDGNGALVNDIDLAVLGSSPHAFARYEEQIRDEYRHVSEPVFRAGRERILRSFLETTSIYTTPFFSQRLESQARTNLARALAALQGSGAREQSR